jgi:hypothetical protein
MWDFANAAFDTLERAGVLYDPNAKKLGFLWTFWSYQNSLYVYDMYLAAYVWE